MRTEEISRPARLAEAGEAISAEELGLAARNHGMPLESLRYDLTPPGLHYLLIHYDIPAMDPALWRLRIGGLVERGLELSLDDLASMPSRTVRVTMECAGNGRARLEPRPISQPWLVEAVGTADWTGVPLTDLLERAGVDQAALEAVFTAADHGFERGVEQDYQRSLTLADARHPEVLVAYAMNGQPLPPQHGFPARLIVPGWYGMAQVKWLTGIELVDQPFEGFQQVAYAFRERPGEPGTPVTRIRPRALLIPPGSPDFMSRARVVRRGPMIIEGRAWCGYDRVSEVEVSVDGGQNWSAATLTADDDHEWAWRRWEFTWDVQPGDYLLTARAATAAGDRQPMDGSWNRGGFGNNGAQLVPVTCLD